jgi:GT2 family glycosyltransferase
VSAEQETEFSVAIVTYNNENEISPCLDSLLRELHGFTHQIIVVDNQSSDHTKEIIKQEYLTRKKHPAQLHFIENKVNLGFTKALNQALEKCQGQYILVLNPDTVIKIGSLKRLRDALQQNSSVGVVAPQLLYSDGTVQPSCRRLPKYWDVVFELTGLSHLFRNSPTFNGWKMGDFDHLNRRKVDQPQGACLLFRSDVLKTVGYWDEGFPMFFSDVDWCRRVKNHGWEIMFEPEAKVIHHRGVSILQSRAKMIWSSHRSFYTYFKKHNRNLKFLFANAILGGILILSAVLRIFWTQFLGFVSKKTAN